MEGYGWQRKYNVWHGTMYSATLMTVQPTHVRVCVRAHVGLRERPDVCTAPSCAHIKSFPIQVSCSEAAVGS